MCSPLALDYITGVFLQKEREMEREMLICFVVYLFLVLS